MGKDKVQNNNNTHSSSKNDPLDFVNKAIRIFKYPAQNAKNTMNEDDDDETNSSSKSSSSFHILERSLIEKSIRHSKIYKPLAFPIFNHKESSPSSSPSKTSPRITVEALDTLAAVVSLALNENIKNPAVLIFASDTNPGGSKTASNAGTQEEAIVRTSTLSVAQRQLPYPIPDLGVAYVPFCQTILPSEGSFVFGAVCSALRLVMSDVNSGKLTAKEKEYLDAKVMSVLACAVQNGHDAIVLGAWGGGAFGAGTDEYLKIVAKSFAEGIEKLLMMDEGGIFLRRIIFAIPTAAKRKQYEIVIGEKFG